MFPMLLGGRITISKQYEYSTNEICLKFQIHPFFFYKNTVFCPSLNILNLFGELSLVYSYHILKFLEIFRQHILTKCIVI